MNVKDLPSFEHNLVWKPRAERIPIPIVRSDSTNSGRSTPPSLRLEDQEKEKVSRQRRTVSQGTGTEHKRSKQEESPMDM